MHARTLITIAVALLAAAGARAQDALTLLRTARVEPGRPVLLGDVARVQGPAAARLSALVLVESPQDQTTDAGGWFRVEIDQVREALEAELGEAAGMIALSGSACDVQAVRPILTPPQDDQERPEAGPVPDAGTLIGLDTIRGAVAREIARVLQTDPTALRLAFEPQDREFLDTVPGARLLEVTAVGSSERMPMGVRLYEADGRSERRTIRVGVQVLRPVAVVSRVLPRAAPIEAADIAIEQRWVAPTDRVVDPGLAVGSVTKRRLEPGELVQTHLIEPPVLVHRGDRVQVRVRCGELILRREAYAMDDATQGQTIEFAARDNPRQRFRAVVVGRGQAAIGFADPAGTGLALGDDAG